MNSPHPNLPPGPALHVLRALSALSVLAIALEYGFDPPVLRPMILHAVQVAVVVVYAWVRLGTMLRHGGRLSALKAPAAELLLLLAGLMGAVALRVSWEVIRLTAVIYVLIMNLVYATSRGLGHVRGRAGRTMAAPRPARLMVLSFTAAIVLGGLLLSLPRAMTVEKRSERGHYATQRILNCFFTATSATCVTGLTVYDTGRDFTRFGQIVILLLMQLGGLGIMTFGSTFGLLLKNQLSLRESLILQDIYSHRTVGEIVHMTKFICISTLVLEAVACAFLYGLWPAEISTPGDRLFHSAFHAVSAFCNAGFTLSHNSLIPVRGAWQVYGVIMPAIVIGGLGFPVLADMRAALWSRFRNWTSGSIFQKRGLKDSATVQPMVRLSLHSKLVLTTTALLIAGPALVLWVLERPEPRTVPSAEPSVMRTMPGPQRLAAALFQSVTCRTAGFNTAAMTPDALTTTSKFGMSILMFIGGSPASTAGGIKTVSIAILVLGVVSSLRKRESVEAFNRRIPENTIRQAAVVILLMFALVSVVVLLLSHTEPASLEEVLFESVSACGTVGLSLGLTPHLTTSGKLVIMLAMIAGRLGPLTVLVALAGRQSPRSYSYPTEQVVIG